MTNKKENKKGDKRKQCRHRNWETKVKKSPGRQMNRNAAWPAENGGHKQYRQRTWKTKSRNHLGDK